MRKTFVIGAGRGALPALLTLALLTSGCATSTASETTMTEAALCDELRRDLPTFSPSDTERTKSDGADFLETFQEECP